MNDLISKIEIDSFRSIRRETILVGNANVFSGLNDVGKSNVLKAINLFFNGQTDFGSGYDFDSDYSKVSLAAVQRSNKKKQQIKIRIYFKVPTSFKSLQDEEVWVERVIDRYGSMAESMSIQDPKKRASITRLINSVQYFYIPALKGPEVLRFILGEVGKRQLVSEEDINKLNDQVNNSIKDLAEILSSSEIKNETRFELPVLVEDFWQKLNINTEYDEFSELDEKINPSEMGSKDLLKKEYFQIPLQFRGDGVKSKFIPPLLQWIQQHEPKKFYIWGIDEPENSLEFKKAQEIADLYFLKYAKNTQLFLTSHSLAFIFAENESVNVFRCYKGKFGETKFENIDNLFRDRNRDSLADEIGALEIQKDVYRTWKERDKEIESLKSEIKKHSKPLLITEGDNTLHIKKALTLLDPLLLKRVDILSGAESRTGKDQLKTVFEVMSHKPSGQKMIFIWDCDAESIVEALKDSLNVFKFCFSINVKNKKVKKGIENLYPQNIFQDKYYQKVTRTDDYGATKIEESFDKKAFLRDIIASNEKQIFENYLPLIRVIKRILNIE